METGLLLLAGAVVGAVVVVLAALRLLRGRRSGEEAQLGRTVHELAGRLDQMASEDAARWASFGKTLEDRLDAVSKRLGDGLTQSTTTTAESLGDLKKRLHVIDEAQKNITELSGQVVGLQDILANKQARGAFGNIQLENLVRAALPPSAYAFEVTLSNKRRADCLIKLPNPPGSIVVDSKFPLEGYSALHNARDEPARIAAGRAFGQSILKHVHDIAERYILPGETAESALMFLPSEAVYAELHANFTGVVEKSYRARVWIVSPTTLMATLNTVRAVLKDAHMREQAGFIQTEVHTMLRDVGRLDERVAKLQRHFDLAREDMREVRISADKVGKRGEKIETMQLGPTEAAEDLEQPRLRIEAE